MWCVLYLTFFTLTGERLCVKLLPIRSPKLYVPFSTYVSYTRTKFHYETQHPDVAQLVLGNISFSTNWEGKCFTAGFLDLSQPMSRGRSCHHVVLLKAFQVIPPCGESWEEIYYPAPRAEEDGLSWVFSSWTHQPYTSTSRTSEPSRITVYSDGVNKGKGWGTQDLNDGSRHQDLCTCLSLASNLLSTKGLSQTSTTWIVIDYLTKKPYITQNNLGTKFNLCKLKFRIIHLYNSKSDCQILTLQLKSF